jgi:hypothetical protein
MYQGKPVEVRAARRCLRRQERAFVLPAEREFVKLEANAFAAAKSPRVGISET